MFTAVRQRRAASIRETHAQTGAARHDAAGEVLCAVVDRLCCADGRGGTVGYDGACVVAAEEGRVGWVRSAGAPGHGAGQVGLADAGPGEAWTMTGGAVAVAVAVAAAMVWTEIGQGGLGALGPAWLSCATGVFAFAVEVAVFVPRAAGVAAEDGLLDSGCLAGVVLAVGGVDAFPEVG